MKQRNRNRNNRKCQIITIARTAMLLIAFTIALFSTLFIPQTASAADVNEEGKTAIKAELKLDEGQECHAYFLFQAQNRGGFRYDNPNSGGQTNDTTLVSDKKNAAHQKDAANQDNNGKAKDERKDNKTLPITIAFIIMIVLAAGSIYLIMKRGKN